MSISVPIRRLATGVPGLDQVLGGGLPEYSFNVIAGAPGSGKTTLAHQLMFALATAERPALYLTVLGEPPLKMLRYQQQFGFFDHEAIHRRIHLVNLGEEAVSGDLGAVLARIASEVELHAPSFVFIDSFRSIVVARGSAQDDHLPRLQHFLRQLGMLMTSWLSTTFLIGEYLSEVENNQVFTLADGLIFLQQSVQRNSMVRKLEVMKMRGQATLPGLHSFRITDRGIQVFAPISASLATDFGRPGRAGQPRLGMGIALLDEMLDGGLPCGSSLLVAGPSGSGKTILALAFLEEGARIGETAVLVAFEQHPDRSRNPRLVDLIESGRVGLIDGRASDISIDEIVAQVLDLVRRLDANRVVLDSLSGFELRLAPTFREDFRESLLRMVTALSSVGVTVMMTSELEDRYTDLRFSPYGTAFLTDAIIVQRYIEVESRLRRVMAVVKVRASAHSDELREYSITDAGIQIGVRLVGQEGLLGGQPSRHLALPSKTLPALESGLAK